MIRCISTTSMPKEPSSIRLRRFSPRWEETLLTWKWLRLCPRQRDTWESTYACNCLSFQTKICCALVLKVFTGCVHGRQQKLFRGRDTINGHGHFSRGRQNAMVMVNIFAWFLNFTVKILVAAFSKEVSAPFALMCWHPWLCVCEGI